MRERLTVVCAGVALYCTLEHLPAVALALRHLAELLSPLFLGGAVAFVLNIPMSWLERQFGGVLRQGRGRRITALGLTALTASAAVAALGALAVPRLQEAAQTLTVQLPRLLTLLSRRLWGWERLLPSLERTLAAADWEALAPRALGLLSALGRGVLSSGVVGEVVGGVATALLALILAVYILLEKERLARQSRQVIFALLPRKQGQRLLEIAELSRRTFSGFLTGQCLEAAALGALFAAGMAVLRLPYALLMGLIMALTAPVPVVGPLAGGLTGVLLLSAAEPWRALEFGALFFLLEQVEAGVLYPRIVASSVGLPPLWVLAAVSVGGRALGLWGIVTGIPLCSVLYTLLGEWTRARAQSRCDSKQM